MSEQTIRIKYNRANILGLGPGVHLYPVSDERPHNDVPLATWKAFENHPQIKGLLADESIQVLDEVAASEPEGEKKTRARAPKAAKGNEAAPKAASEPAAPTTEPGEAEQALAALGLS